MRSIITTLILLLLVAFNVNAQSYQPVKAGGFYSLMDNGGKIHHLEVIETVAQGSDTIFRFNRMCRNANPWTTAMDCNFDPVFAEYGCDRENIWGDYMLKEPGGEYYFVTKDSQTFYLPVNNLSTPFTFYTGASGTITGSYTNTLYNVSINFPTDSVRVFTLSNGQQIHVSSDHGIFEAFDFMALDTVATSTNHYTLADVNFVQGDADFKNVTDFYDFQVGDRRVLLHETWNFMGDLIYKKQWQEDSILSVVRTTGQQLDTLTITYRRRYLTDLVPSYPENSLDTTYWSAWSTVTEQVRDYGVISQEFTEFQPANSAFLRQSSFDQLFGGPFYTQAYITSMWQDSCHNYLSHTWDWFTEATYAYPFGLTFGNLTSFTSTYTNLLCYSTSGQTWGSCPNWGTILNQEEAFLPSIEVYPNPGHGEVAVRLGQPVEMTIEVRDLQGKIVAPRHTGKGQVDLDLEYLPAGVYVLRISIADQIIHKKWNKISR